MDFLDNISGNTKLVWQNLASGRCLKSLEKQFFEELTCQQGINHSQQTYPFSKTMGKAVLLGLAVGLGTGVLFGPAAVVVAVPATILGSLSWQTVPIGDRIVSLLDRSCWGETALGQACSDLAGWGFSYVESLVS